MLGWLSLRAAFGAGEMAQYALNSAYRHTALNTAAFVSTVELSVWVSGRMEGRRSTGALSNRSLSNLCAVAFVRYVARNRIRFCNTRRGGVGYRGARNTGSR